MVNKVQSLGKDEFLDRRARQVFEDLGYSVRRHGDVLSAERDGKVVCIASVSRLFEKDECPVQWEDNKYCFVTEVEKADTTEEKVSEVVPENSDWVIMGVDDNDYRVVG